MSTDALLTLRDGTKHTRKAKTVWHPPTHESLIPGRVIAVDPSLGACGVVALRVSEERIEVVDAVVLSTEFDGKFSTEADLIRADELVIRFGEWLTERPELSALRQMVYEVPPEGGGVLKHLRSALLAASAIRRVAADMGFSVLPGISPQTHKRFTCGNPYASKPEHRAAVIELGSMLNVSGFHSYITNEAKRDAFSVSLCSLRRMP